jgi:hypothetical protein
MSWDQAQYLTGALGASGHGSCSYCEGRALGTSLRCSGAQNPGCAVRIVVRWPCARGASALLAFGATSSVRGAREAVGHGHRGKAAWRCCNHSGCVGCPRGRFRRPHAPAGPARRGRKRTAGQRRTPTPCPQCQRRRPHDRGADDRRVSTRDSGLSAMSRSDETLARSSPGRLDRRAHFIARHSIVRSEQRIVPAGS